jgi:hypothetical protein
MFPPAFSIAASDNSVKALLGPGTAGNPVRFWAFGEAPRDAQGNPAGGTPYAVWQIITGSAENYIDKIPDIDSHSIQIDCYSNSFSNSRDVAKALRDAMEPHAYVTAWNGEFRDQPTGLYRVSFTMEFLTPRTET